MSNDIAQDVSQADAPTRLTRRALFDLRLEEMRRRGESTDGMSQLAPTISWPKEDSAVRVARNLALIDALGLNDDTSWMVAERERQEKQEIAWKEAMDREESELRKNTSAVYNAPYDTPYKAPYDSRGLYPSSTDSLPHFIDKTDHKGGDQFQYSSGSQPLRNNTDARNSDHANNGSDWRHSSELGLLQNDMLEAAKFRPETRSLYRTFDMNAFTGDPVRNDNTNAQQTDEAATASAIPISFPPYSTVNSAVDVAVYLALSSYIISLGGPPLPDLKYGIIIVPAGEESLLFTGNGDDAAMSPDFLDEIRTKSKKAQKEQMEEFRQKAAEELANGSEWEPELDDQEREFYRQRWWDRTGRHRYNSGQFSDYLANRKRRRLFEGKSWSGPIQGNEIASRSASYIGYAERKSIRSNSRASNPGICNNDPMKRDALIEPDQSLKYDVNDPPTFPTNKSVESPRIRHVVDCGSQEQKALKQERISMRSDSRASNRDASSRKPLETTADIAQNSDSAGLPDSAVHKAVEVPSSMEECDLKDQSALTQENPSMRSQGSRASNCESYNSVLQNTGTRGKSHKAPNYNSDNNNSDNQTRLLTSKLASSKSAILKESMSLEARQTLELLLGKKKRRGMRGIFKSILSSFRSKEDLVTSRRDVLLEIGEAVTSLANGKLHDNPGIDRRIWEAARHDVAISINT